MDVAIASADEVLNAKAQDKPKKPKIENLTDAQLSAMIVAIGEGKVSIVQERMSKYKLTKNQKTKLNELILEADLKIKEEEKSNGVLGIIDELNSIEVPTEYKSNNQ